MPSDATAALLLAYGGPDSLDDVAPYLADVRGGRATPQRLVEEVRSRYAVIGGRSPLLARTREQAAALATALGPAWRTSVGMRHWKPYIAETLEALAAEGVRRVVALPMAPHHSELSVGAYRRACEAAPAVQRRQVRLAFVPGWSRHAGFIQAVAERVGAALPALGDERAMTLVIFSAHSLPERILETGDRYVDELTASTARVAERLCLTDFRHAFQSAGATSQRWLGPDVSAVMDEAAAAGYERVLVVPIGFVCDNVEILYDVDIVYRERAARLGLRFARTESLNASSLLIAALADLARGAADEAGWS